MRAFAFLLMPMLALVTLTGLSSAQAHALLKTAEPPVGAKIATPPAQLRLHFTEKVEIAFSGVTVSTADGTPLGGTTLATAPDDHATLVVELPGALTAGTYKVSWHVVSVDTHKTSGDYTFAVGGSAAPSAPIQVEQPWARATAGALGTGIVYATIVNTGASDDRLIAATTPIAIIAELHQTVETNGVSQMPPVQGIMVTGGSKAILAPGGYHVMLEDLKQPLKAGDRFPLTLTFEKAGKIDVTVKVESAGAAGPDDTQGTKAQDSMPGMKM